MTLLEFISEKLLGPETVLGAELDKLALTIANVPNAETMQYFVERAGNSIFVLDEDGHVCEGGNSIATWLTMNRDDHRKLIQMALTGNLPDGRPAGVYVKSIGPKRFSYTILGLLVEETLGVMPRVLP